MVKGSRGSATPLYVVTPTEKDIYTAMRAWLLSILPDCMRVIQGQQNRAAAPLDPFAVMTIIARDRIATNGWSYTDTTRVVEEQVKLTMQVSVFGQASSNQMQLITALWRDMEAVDYFRAQPIPITPLYTSSTRQLGFINGERQYEDCWSVDLTMQVNLTVSVPQQFADSLSVDLIEVDTSYPEQE
ncbi:LIC_12616 family protein [Acetobacter sp.]|uniref:phage neck terminator protein n=1 Tax=Acetobacter sp. TaxID=440 RepID=UPI0039ECF6AB